MPYSPIQDKFARGQGELSGSSAHRTNQVVDHELDTAHIYIEAYDSVIRGRGK
jgi:hypothetical protein